MNSLVFLKQQKTTLIQVPISKSKSNIHLSPQSYTIKTLPSPFAYEISVAQFGSRFNFLKPKSAHVAAKNALSLASFIFWCRELKTTFSVCILPLPTPFIKFNCHCSSVINSLKIRVFIFFVSHICGDLNIFAFPVTRNSCTRFLANYRRNC